MGDMVYTDCPWNVHDLLVSCHTQFLKWPPQLNQVLVNLGTSESLGILLLFSDGTANLAISATLQSTIAKYLTRVSLFHNPKSLQNLANASRTLSQCFVRTMSFGTQSFFYKTGKCRYFLGKKFLQRPFSQFFPPNKYWFKWIKLIWYQHH